MYKFLFALCAVLTTNAFASTNQLDVGFGPSITKGSGNRILSLPAGVSRNNGGEHLYVSFKSPKNILSLKVVGYSASRTGKVLIRSASVVTDSNQNIGLEGLTNFSKIGLNDRAENNQNLVMLSDLASVTVEPKQALTSIDLVVEGFANNDASVLLQIVSSDDLSTKEFIVTRSGSGSESVGEYFDERNYARFTIPQIQLLMKISKTPTINDLAGKTFSCSIYNSDAPVSLEYKTRQYFVGNTPNVLQSSTDLSSSSTVWIRNQYGWTISNTSKTKYCGPIANRLVARMTPEGNLVGEWMVEINEFVQACELKNYNGAETRASILKWNPLSIIDPKFVSSSYEFCRQVSYP